MDPLDYQIITDYCIHFSSKEEKVLEDLRRETHLKTLHPGMLSGPLQGKLLNSFVRMKQAFRILEIGTFTGYASLYLAEALPEKGKLVTLELEEELSYYHDKYFPLLPYGHKIEVIYGDANDYIENTDEQFDMAFMDAGKKDYTHQFDNLVNLMGSGGVIIADNVLWKGKVTRKEQDKVTRYLHEFNQHVRNDSRVTNVILPFRDGLNIITIN